MREFHLDLRDIRFNLFDDLDVGSILETDVYSDFDVELLDDVLAAAAQQAAEVLHPLNASGDREGARFVDGRVISPEGWKEAYKLYSESGWVAMSVPQESGGQGMPFVLHGAALDIFTSANTSFIFTPELSAGVIGLLDAFGSAELKDLYLEHLLTGEWTGTMCLTEPSAGSAVPDLKCGAIPTGDDTSPYRMRGQKIFISSGDHDLAENIVHMVLAKAEDDTNISMFVVPRLRPDGSGGLEPNDVVTVGIEEKLGIHASPTCALSFGDEDDCLGWLVGERQHGLRCMFHMMNGARITVGMQGVGLANAAYQQSVRYAKERVQGTHISNFRKADAPRVAIIEHPDVRRMLMYMKAVAEGGRALGYYASSCIDRERTADTEPERKRWLHQLEILTPIVKAWCSDEAFRAAELGIQVHGGYGYIREYGMEQILRDVKIASLYEGTNGIQALDLLGRKVARGGGVMMMTMLNEMNKLLGGPAKDGPFAAEVKAVSRARDAVAQTAMDFGQRSMKGDIAYSALHATPFLQMFGDLAVGWRLLHQAVVAKRLYDARLQQVEIDPLDEELGNVLTEDEEARFLHGKIATAHFFIHQILPRVHARKLSIESDDRSALTVVL